MVYGGTITDCNSTGTVSGGDNVGGRQHYWGFLNAWGLWGRVHGAPYPWNAPWDDAAAGPAVGGGSIMNIVLLDGGIDEIDGRPAYPMQINNE